jgi:hypothetical protein
VVTTDPLRHTKEVLTEQTDDDDDSPERHDLSFSGLIAAVQMRVLEHHSAICASLEMHHIYCFDLRNNFHYVGFEVYTAVAMKSSIFWDTTPCSPLKVNRRFGGTCRVHVQGRRICSSACYLPSRWFFARLIFRP